MGRKDLMREMPFGPTRPDPIEKEPIDPRGPPPGYHDADADYDDDERGDPRSDPTERVSALAPRARRIGIDDDDDTSPVDERGDSRSDSTEGVSSLAPRARRIGIDDDDDTSPVDERGDPRSDPTEEASFDPRVPRPGIDDDDDTSSATDDRGDLRSAMFNPHAPRIPIAMAPQQGFVINAGVELPRMIVPRPNVDPLAALRGPQEGQSEEERRDAYAKMMEQFQLEGSKVCHSLPVVRG